MTRLALSAAVAALLAGAANAAPTNEHTMTVTGNVTEACLMQQLSKVSGPGSFTSNTASGNVFLNTTSSSVYDLGQIDHGNGKDRNSNGSGNVELAFDDAFCNVAHTVSLQGTNGGFQNTSGTTVIGGTFVTQLGYDASIEWANETVSLDVEEVLTGGTGPGMQNASENITGAYAGDLTFKLNVDAGQAFATPPILAGDYEEEFVITLAVTP